MNYSKLFFERQTPEQAYFMGLFAADGCVNETGGSYQIRIRLRTEDESTLSMIHHWLQLKSSISRQQDNRWKKKCSSSCLGFNSKWVGDWLISKGLMPRKSTKLGVVDYPESYPAEFVRGYFDGDGCLTSRDNGKGKRYPCLSFFGTKRFMEFIEGIINKECGVITKGHYQRGDLHQIRFSKREDLMALRAWLSGVTFGMPRKLEVNYA